MRYKTSSAISGLILLWCLLSNYGCSDNNSLGFSFKSTIAYAGEDQSIQIGQSITLDGTGSKHGRNNSLSFSWLQLSGPAIEIENPNSGILTVMPPSLGRYVFRLTIIDNTGATSTDEVVITVNEVKIEDVAKTGEIEIAGSFEQ